jgi:hypothetical protein
VANPTEGGFYGLISGNEDAGTSTYNGLLLSVQRRAADGIDIGANYTWSRCIGPTSTFSHNSGGGYLDPNNRDFDRGNCESDRRQVFNLTASATTRQFASPAARILASNWRLAGIYRKSTGRFLTTATGTDRALNGEVGPQRVNQILGDPYGNRDGLNYLNPSAFAQPALGTISNMSPNSIEGPGNWAFDLALSRNFTVREGQRLEFRGEAFNVLNSFIPGDPTANFTNYSNNTFGQINFSRDARIMQFVLKYVF